MKIISAILLLALPCMAQDVVKVEDRIASVVEVTKTATSIVCTVNVSQHKPSWRFCHDGKVLQVAPFFSNGETTSKKKIVECPTLAEALAKIKTLNLKVTKEQTEQLAELKPVPLVKEVIISK